MKKLRIVTIGFMIGGALGAKVAALMLSTSSLGYDWSWITSGLIAGSVLGISIAAAIAWADAPESKAEQVSSVSQITNREERKTLRTEEPRKREVASAMPV